MARRRDPDREQAKRLDREADLERDMIYELRFVRKDWNQGDDEAKKYFPPIRAIGDPRKNDYALKSAIADFQRQHRVADWHDIAADYETHAYWYG